VLPVPSANERTAFSDARRLSAASIQAYPREADYYVNMRILTLIMCGNVHPIKMHHASSREGERRDSPRNASAFSLVNASLLLGEE